MFRSDIPTQNVLLQDVIHVLHTAWEVDFDLAVESFAFVDIKGVRKLIYFCARSANKLSNFFISSVSSLLNAERAKPWWCTGIYF